MARKEYEHMHETHDCDGEGHQHHHHTNGSCCCEQHAKEFHGIDKVMLVRLIVSALCYCAAKVFPVSETTVLVLLLIAALSAGYDIALTAVKNLLKGSFFDEYFLMFLAAGAAFAIGEAEEGAAVLLLYRIGAFCQSYAISHSRRAIAGVGESELLHTEKKGKTSFITRFARIYTPIVLLLSAVIAVGLTVFDGRSVREVLYPALTFLVLACPCAVAISVPLTYFAGISGASKRGIFFHDAEALDTVARQQAGESGILLTEGARYEQAVLIARRTRRIAAENVCFTLLIKLAVLILGLLRISPLWFAVFADSGVTVLAVLNALRAFRNSAHTKP